MRDVTITYGTDYASQIIASKKRIAELEAENEQLSQQICDECSPDDYGWNYNAVEGRVPCVCIIESGAYQELEAENRIFRSTESVDDSVWDALLEQVRTYQEKLDKVREWAWELHDSLKLHQCGDGCNGCPVCRIPDDACDAPDELLSALGDGE